MCLGRRLRVRCSGAAAAHQPRRRRRPWTRRALAVPSPRPGPVAAAPGPSGSSLSPLNLELVRSRARARRRQRTATVTPITLTTAVATVRGPASVPGLQVRVRHWQAPGPLAGARTRRALAGRGSRGRRWSHDHLDDFKLKPASGMLAARLGCSLYLCCPPSAAGPALRHGHCVPLRLRHSEESDWHRHGFIGMARVYVSVSASD